MTHYTEEELDRAEAIRKKSEKREARRQLRKVAKKLGVSIKYLEVQQVWIKEGRAPTQEEYTIWARGQHKRACKEYQAAYPITGHSGKCQHMLENQNKPCVSFFSHTGICETGYFIPERMPFLILSKFNQQARKAARRVKRELRLSH